VNINGSMQKTLIGMYGEVTDREWISLYVPHTGEGCAEFMECISGDLRNIQGKRLHVGLDMSHFIAEKRIRR